MAGKIDSMPKIAKPLTAIEVKRITQAGTHAVGTVAGLTLVVGASGSRSWILRTKIGSKRREIGLGSYPAVSLAEAHGKARQELVSIKAGIDPIAARKAKRSTIEWTFKRCAHAYIKAHEPSWTNNKHAAQWRSTLETYAFPVFGDKHVKDIETADVTSAISPLWSAKNETMVRVRNRIELVISWAVAHGYRPGGLNPATWRGHLDQVLPKPSRVNQRRHFPATPIDDMQDFMRRLRQVDGISARCLEFVILTACRSGEARGATWTEIDMAKAEWNIPAQRMKAKRPHRIPLNQSALTLLADLPRTEGCEYVFPGRDLSKPLSDMSLTQTMRRLKSTAVPHGFRSTFTDWCSERTTFPSEVREMALAHAIGNQTEEAYRRGDLFEKRRALMAEWCNFLAEPVSEPALSTSAGTP
jgi:integrase